MTWRSTSAGAITDGGTGTAVVLAAAGASLVASTGIGTSSAPIEAQITVLAANAGSGGLWLANSGSLHIGVLRTVTGLGAGGAIDVTTSGTLGVDQNVSAPGSITLDASVPPSIGDVLTVQAGVLVKSTGSSITLQGAGNITLAAGATLSAGTTIAIIGNDPAGSTVDLDGALHATSASITTGTGTDAININQLPGVVPLTVDGGGGTGNALSITGTSGNDSFTITSSQVSIQVAGSTITNNIAYSDIQLMVVNGANPVVTGSQGGNDTFTVNSSSAATTLDCGPGNDTLNLYATSGVLNAPVDFVGGAGHNTVNVFDQRTGDTIAMADESIQVVQGVSAFVAGLSGAGLQLTYSNPTEAALHFNLNTGMGNNTVFVLGTRFFTNINASSGTTSINLGGAPPAIPIAGGGLVTVPAIEVLADGTTYSTTISGVSTTFESGFDQPIAIIGGGSGTTLAIDDSAYGQPAYPELTATSVTGLGEYEPAIGPHTITFAGIGAMTLDLGTGATQLMVQSTIAAAGPVTINTSIASTASASIVVRDFVRPAGSQG